VRRSENVQAEAEREVGDGQEKSGNGKVMTKTGSTSRRLVLMKMNWTTEKAEGAEFEAKKITPGIGIKERKRLGGRKWRRRCSGRGCRGNDSRIHNNGANSTSFVGVTDRVYIYRP